MCGGAREGAYWDKNEDYYSGNRYHYYRFFFHFSHSVNTRINEILAAK